MVRIAAAAFATGAWIVAATAADAALVTYQFTGVVTVSSVAGVSAGDPIIGFYTFDNAVADLYEEPPPIPDGSGPHIGIYPQTTPAGFQIGGLVVLTTFDATGFGSISTLNNRFGLDSYSVNVGAVFSLTLQDFSQTLLGSDDLPASPPNPALASSTQFYYDRGAIIGVLSQIVAGPPNVFDVPAPGAGGLLLAGLALIGWAARRAAA